MEALTLDPARAAKGRHPWRTLPLSAFRPFVTSGSRGWAPYYSEHGEAFIRITNLTRESIDLI